jgi:hypothetical protein
MALFIVLLEAGKMNDGSDIVVSKEDKSIVGLALSLDIVKNRILGNVNPKAKLIDRLDLSDQRIGLNVRFDFRAYKTIEHFIANESDTDCFAFEIRDFHWHLPENVIVNIEKDCRYVKGLQNLQRSSYYGKEQKFARLPDESLEEKRETSEGISPEKGVSSFIANT